MEETNINIKRGVSAIIFDKRGSSFFFLILHKSKGWEGWEFPKGKVEAEESSEDAVTRLVKIGAGLRSFKIFGKLTQTRDFINNGVRYSFETFLIEANMNVTVNIHDDEHDNFLWAPKDRVLDKLHWPDEKGFFVEVVSTLEEKHS
jgi:8-oxo-dGTP pyrophosphatase MutT (NUDIX family)